MLSSSLSLVCFGAGLVAFVRFFRLASLLAAERIGPPPGKLLRLFPWLPGQFTAAGERLYRQMNMLLLVGWVFLMLGIVLSR